MTAPRNPGRAAARERAPRIEAARRDLLQAMADIETRHGLSAVESLDVLAAYQQFLIGFSLAHPTRAFAAAATSPGRKVTTRRVKAAPSAARP